MAATTADATAASAAAAPSPAAAVTSTTDNAVAPTSAAAAANSATSSDAAAASSSSSSSSAAATPAVTVETEPAAAAAAEPAPKQWKIAEVPEGADPLDYINMEKLKEDNKNMPTTKEGIAKFLNEMPITADVMPDRQDMNREFLGIQSMIDETPLDERAANFKDSGNEAYKLSLKMKKDWTEATAKREAAAKAAAESKQPAKKLTLQEQKDEDYEVSHLKKLKESAHKRLLDAVTYYTQALDVELDPMQTENGKLHLSKRLKAQILANRALVHHALQNYGRAQADCDEALKLDPKHPKACYRGAQACLACNPPKLAKARVYITAGRVVDEKRKKIDWQFRAEQKGMDDLEARVVALEKIEQDREDKKKAAAAAAALATSQYNSALSAALQSRGLKLGPLVFDFARSAYAEQSKEGPGKLPRAMLHPAPPAPYTPSSTLSWPLLILYPEILQSDFVQECREEHSLADHLRNMFPPQTDYAPWDEKKQYTFDNLSVWIDTRGPNVPHDSTPAQDAAARMLVNPSQSLRAILSNPKLAKKGYVIPGIPTFIILPKQ